MGLFGMKWFGRHHRTPSLAHATPHSRNRLRACRVERFEERKMLAGDVQLGVVYYEDNSGQDDAGDTIEITFTGGEPGSQLTELTILTDKLGDGLTIGDVFFDIADGGLGAFKSSPFHIVSQQGIDNVFVDVVDGGTSLKLTFVGFEAGDRLIFTIDVDEQGFLGPNAVAEGNEFEGSQLHAVFTAEHFYDGITSDIFLDAYDAKLNATNLDLPRDSYVPPGSVPTPIYTAGAIITLTQVPLPIEISGTVYEDPNVNNVRDNGEIGLADVSLTLLVFNGTDYDQVGTTTTDTNGNYTFTNVLPGQYRIVETQPNGYLSVGATAGTVNGVTRGAVINSDVISDIILVGGENSIRNDFAETRPATLSGYVYHDRDDDGVRDGNEEGIGGVLITVQRVVTNGPVPAPISVLTDATGRWVAGNLFPGTYIVTETQPNSWLDGRDTPGNLGGTAANPGDQISGIVILGNQSGTEYNFGELLPVSIQGRVIADLDGDCILDPDEHAIAGVTVYLLDANGVRIDETLTDQDGFYKFSNLAPGTYGVEEIQPEGYFQGDQMVGSAGGVIVRDDLMNQIVLTSGVNAIDYNFCELIPASIEGRVIADLDGDCILDPDEHAIAGVTIYLLDANGVRIQETKTDADGFYKFDQLAPGTYGVEEIQPNGYFQGDQMVGSAGGVIVRDDLINQIVLAPGVNAVDYNFCELIPASIEGRVIADLDGDCILDPDEHAIAGVTIYLLDANGVRIQETKTDADGFYKFDQLAPGTYGVEEIQPNGYFQGDQMVGSAGGVIVRDDLIGQIVLGPGVDAVDYNFCELIPASIEGRVIADLDGDCILDPDEHAIAGVTIYLLDANGVRIQETKTDADGFYKFDQLAPGTYGVEEIQPNGYFQGDQMVGSAGGVIVRDDLINQIVLAPGVDAVDYNFCELVPASIQGLVFADLDGDCILDANEQPIANVTVYLLDANGVRIQETKTDADGFYKFDTLAPGTYGVEEIQPVGYFQGDQMVGSAGGVIVRDDLIGQIVLGPGVHAVDYDFCEVPPAKISGYVFQDGPPIQYGSDQQLPTEAFPLQGLKDGIRRPGSPPLTGVVLRLGDLSGEPVYDSAGNPITTVTDANGYYEFTNLEPGIYTVLQEQPASYLDGLDTPGSTGGIPFNLGTSIDPEMLTVDANFDAIARIRVRAGDISVENNFSEVLVQQRPGQPPFPVPPDYPQPLTLAQPLGGIVQSPAIPPAPNLPPDRPRLPLGSGGVRQYTWHLSVIDAGQPRSIRSKGDAVVMRTTSRFDAMSWTGNSLSQAHWLIDRDGDGIPERFIFGTEDGIPVAGDFNGDGFDEVGVYINGEWFIDLNGNGVWDADDLWAKLGHEEDLPVTGDWDGDGKTDIGIFGPAWPGDPRAVAAEPGLPDPHNPVSGPVKNIPPRPDQATLGHRVMKRTSLGTLRKDLIDHVFFYGTNGDLPVTGDWNGDGTASIGIYRGGRFVLDTNGNGRIDADDQSVDLGIADGIPIVGDFDGDGLDEVGLYADGILRMDSNHNGTLDPRDYIAQVGESGDTPVAGDFNGDGVDELVIYRPGTPAIRGEALER